MSLKEIPYTALGFFLLIQKISVCLYCLAEMKTQICEYWKQFFKKHNIYNTRNSAQCHVAIWKGGEFGGEWQHVYAWLSPFAVHLKLSYVDGYTPIQNKKFLKIKKIAFIVVFINCHFLLRDNSNNNNCLLLSCLGNGTPLQYSCLENPMDGGAW